MSHGMWADMFSDTGKLGILCNHALNASRSESAVSTIRGGDAVAAVV